MNANNDETSDLINMADIARMSGQSRATVGNWKRRYADFPTEKGRTPRGPLYDSEEVASWIAKHVEAGPRPGGRDRLGKSSRTFWSALDQSESDSPTHLVMAVLVLIIEILEGSSANSSRSAIRDDVMSHLRSLNSNIADELQVVLETLPESMRTLAEEAARSRETASAAIDSIIDRAQSVGRMRIFETETPRSVAALMAQLAGPGDSVFDPCIGIGSVTAAIAAVRQVEVRGQEINSEAAILGYLNNRARGVNIRIDLVDSIREESDKFNRADIVVLAPPFGMRLDDADVLTDDPRWTYGEPRRSDADMAWIQVGLAGLEETGRMVALMAPSILHPSGNALRIIQRIIKSDLLDCVISMPSRMFFATSIPTAILVFDPSRRSRATSVSPSPVLLIDGERVLEFKGIQRTREITSSSISALGELVDSWRNGREPSVPGALSVSFGELAEGGFVLDQKRYEPPAPTESSTELKAQRALIVETLATALEVASESVLDIRQLGTPPLVAVEAEWQSLGDIDGLHLLRGVNPSATNPESGIPVMSVRAVEEQSKPRAFLTNKRDFEIQLNDIVVSLSAPTLGVAIEASQSFVPDHTAVLLRVEDGCPLSVGFLLRWFKTESFRSEVERMSRGSTFSRVMLRDFESIKIPVPSPEFQNNLTREFQRIDEARAPIALVLGLIKNLESIDGRLLAAQLKETR
jgi:type I restriction-modification system DNA methylase subunit